MKKLIYIPLIVCLLLFTGCGTKSVMNGIMSSWEGVHLRDVVKQWGYPNASQEMFGNKLYTWTYVKGGYIPRSTTGTAQVIGNTVHVNTMSTGGHRISGVCNRTLEVNADGIVSGWQWSGNNCPFAEAFEYRHWRNKTPTPKEEDDLKQSMEWVNPKELPKYKAQLLKQGLGEQWSPST